MHACQMMMDGYRRRHSLRRSNRAIRRTVAVGNYGTRIHFTRGFWVGSRATAARRGMGAEAGRLACTGGDTAQRAAGELAVCLPFQIREGKKRATH
jgi:hypothetical protein